jgi:hypothetical protein
MNGMNVVDAYSKVVTYATYERSGRSASDPLKGVLPDYMYTDLVDWKNYLSREGLLYTGYKAAMSSVLDNHFELNQFTAPVMNSPISLYFYEDLREFTSCLVTYLVKVKDVTTDEARMAIIPYLTMFSTKLNEVGKPMKFYTGKYECPSNCVSVGTDTVDLSEIVSRSTFSVLSGYSNYMRKNDIQFKDVVSAHSDLFENDYTICDRVDHISPARLFKQQKKDGGSSLTPSQLADKKRSDEAKAAKLALKKKVLDAQAKAAAAKGGK